MGSYIERRVMEGTIRKDDIGRLFSRCRVTDGRLPTLMIGTREPCLCPIAYVDSNDGNLLCEIELIVDAREL